MFALKLNHLLLLTILHVSDCQRRITDGEIVNSEKRYVVYLLKSTVSPQYYTGWMCGGALVSPDFIVTSAACVTDVKHLYAIAGYKKYISDEEIFNDPCTKEKKKKIILTCVPKAYELKYEQLEVWSLIDIAVVKVESPYDFADESYATVCSYTPAPIIVNYEVKYQEPGTDSIVFGWGHQAKWRQQGDPANYNQELLNYSPTLLINKEECKTQYGVYNGMAEVIDRYMICSLEKGNINAEGETISKSPPIAQGCLMHTLKLRGYESLSCENAAEPEEEIVLIENSRRNGKPSNLSSDHAAPKHNSSLNEDVYRNVIDSNVTYNDSLIDRIYKNIVNSKKPMTRRHGICQNDHGGPLVTWVGSHEVLIGVASVFKISEDFDCIGPYLYTSTQCNGAFLDCVIRSNENQTFRRELCDRPASEKGYELIETHISWKDHPDGPADNEKDIVSSTTTANAVAANTRTANATTPNTTNNQMDTTTTQLTNTTYKNPTVTPPTDPTTNKIINVTSKKLNDTENINLLNNAPITITTNHYKNIHNTTLIKQNNNVTENKISLTTTNPMTTTNVNVINVTTTTKNSIITKPEISLKNSNFQPTITTQKALINTTITKLNINAITTNIIENVTAKLITTDITQQINENLHKTTIIDLANKITRNKSNITTENPIPTSTINVINITSSVTREINTQTTNLIKNANFKSTGTTYYETLKNTATNDHNNNVTTNLNNITTAKPISIQEDRI